MSGSFWDRKRPSEEDQIKNIVRQIEQIRGAGISPQEAGRRDAREAMAEAMKQFREALQKPKKTKARA